jgi:hypothetical protein
MKRKKTETGSEAVTTGVQTPPAEQQTSAEGGALSPSPPLPPPPPLSAGTAASLALLSPTEGSSTPFVFSAGANGSPAAASPPPPVAADDEEDGATLRLVEACRAGDPEGVKERLPAADVNRSCRQGAAAGFSAPPLWWASETGQPECVSLLLAAGARVEVRHCFH